VAILETPSAAQRLRGMLRARKPAQYRDRRARHKPKHGDYAHPESTGKWGQPGHCGGSGDPL